MELFKKPPHRLLLKFLPQIKPGCALDIGCGAGHDSFFLSKNGFKVEAIDMDLTYIKNLNKISKKYKLNINAFPVDIRGYKIEPEKYNLILAIQSLVFLKKSEYKVIINSIKNGLKPEGVVIVSGFTVKDPSFSSLQKYSPMIEENTFKSKTNQYWQFFEKNELKNYFKNDFQILFYGERYIKDKIPYSHSHEIVEMVAKKKYKR